MPRMMQMHITESVKFVTVLFLICGMPELFASEHRGVIRFNEMPVPGAAVTAIRGEKQLSTIADSQGLYLFPDLTDGEWTLQAAMPGFRREIRQIMIEPEKGILEWDLAMLPFSEMKTEPIAASLEGAPGESFMADTNRLPDATDTPPSDQTGSTAALPKGPFANLSPEQLSERAADGFLINGSINNSAASPFSQSAAFGNNRFRKSLYNGSLGIVLNNSALEARPFSLTGQNTPKADYNRSQISLNIGGPIILPHLIRNGPSFYIGYQRIRDRNATVQTSRMPTVAERNGDLSQSLPAQIFDPDTGIPFDNNVIPQNRISPQARSLMVLFPLPNDAGRGRYNYQVPIVSATHQDSIQGWLHRGHSIGQITGSYNYQNIRTDSPNVFYFLDTGRASSLSLGASFSRNYNRQLGVNLQYRFERSTRRMVPYFANRFNVSGEAGISGNNQDSENWGPPNLSFSNFERLTDAEGFHNREQTSAVVGEIRLNQREHYLSIGMNYRRQQLNTFSQQNSRGSFTFTGAAAGYDFADFLLGIPDTSSIAFGNADKYLRSASYAAYINDDWRISAGITLNAGIRWEYEAPMTELYGRLANLDIADTFAEVAPVLGSNPAGLLTRVKYPTSLVRPDKRGIQPRIGFAWRPVAASSLVIRAGYGIYRDTSVYRAIADQMAQQPPFSKSMSIGNSMDTPLTMANGFNVTPKDIANTFAIDPDFRVAVAQNWHLSVQRDIPLSMQVVATYLGARGSHLIRKSLPNTYPMGAVSSCATCPSGFIYESSDGKSIRHAGQIQLRRRLRNGFSAEAQYVFSKSMDDAALGTTGGGGAFISQNWLNPEAERSLSSFDQRHQLNIQAQYTSGAGLFHSMLMQKWYGVLLKEWTLSGKMALSSGQPLTPVYAAAVPGTGVTGSMRPNRTAAFLYDAPAGLFLNPAAYAIPESGKWGNAGRNSIIGPKQFSLDVSLGRSFRYRDRVNIEFRLDSSNVLNHVTFTGWNATTNSSQFGLPDRANPMRKVQANLRMSF